MLARSSAGRGPAPFPLVVGKWAMTMSDLKAVPLHGAYRPAGRGMTKGSDAEVQVTADGKVRWTPEAKRDRIDSETQDSVEHGSRMLGRRRPYD